MCNSHLLEINTKIVVIITGIDMEVRKTAHSSIPKAPENTKSKKGMVLPFRPLSLAFQDVNYYIDMPLVTSNSLLLYHFNHVP